MAAMIAWFLLALASTARADDSFLVSLTLNAGFEHVADSTTLPPKYGAYWEHAFSTKECDPTSCIVELDDGNRAARLDPFRPALRQILTLHGPYSREFAVELRYRLETPDSRVFVRFESEEGRELTWIVPRLESDASGLEFESLGRDDGGFERVRIHVGTNFESLAGGGPPPWGQLSIGAIGGAVLVDDVVAAHRLPRVSHRELRDALLADVRSAIAVYVEPPSGPSGLGLGLVERASGYQTRGSFDVETGKGSVDNAVVGITGIHEVLLRYARIASLPVDDPTRLAAREILRNLAISAMQHNVYSPTGLFCLYDRKRRGPEMTVELSPTHFIQTVLDIADLFPDDPQLQSYARFHCERMADAMVRLRREHDLPPDVKYGRGAGGNWFGRMPEKVSPLGVLAPPMKATYDQSWAIAFDRSWYHDFDTSVGLMRVHRVIPKEDYLEAVRIVCAKFDRAWDATRYDMENDTDDHYGRNVESALDAYRYSGHALPEVLEFVQRATDHRLPRGVPAGETTWVQSVRLGSFTTGDQPRAFRGPIGLYRLPQDVNPETSGYEPYIDVLRELTRADLRRRLLDDSTYTEASSFQWRMIAMCFRKNFIAPCDSGTDWEGDMGDLFAGPPANAYRALIRMLEIDHPGHDREWVTWYALVHEHVMARYRAKYGYRFGMSKETGRRYGIHEQYLNGWNNTHGYGLAITLLHTELLETGVLDREPHSVRIAEVTRADDGTVRVDVVGPPSRAVDVSIASTARLEEVAAHDARLRHVPRSRPHATTRITLDDQGRGEARFQVDTDRVAIDVELPCVGATDFTSPRIEDLSGGVFDL